MFQVDQQVRILESAFAGSDDPIDVNLRGQIVTLAFDLSETHGADWKGCWAAWSNGQDRLVHLTEDEIEALS